MKKTMLFLISLLAMGASLLPCYQNRQSQDATIQLLEKGIDLYRSGEYEEALKVFSEVLRLSVNKDEIIRTRVYLGYTHFALNELDKAMVEIYEAIKESPDLKLNPDEFSEEFIKFFDTAINQVVGTAFIESTPAGAKVWIDKKPIGTTPLKIQLLSQRYALRVVKGGYSPYKDTIEVRSDSIVPIKVDLNKTKNWKSFTLSTLIMGAVTILIQSI